MGCAQSHDPQERGASLKMAKSKELTIANKLSLIEAAAYRFTYFSRPTARTILCFCKGNAELDHISALMIPPLGRERGGSTHPSQRRQPGP
ncbi:hypothetical protein GOODEAATRI_013770 [Goodea atripinnis]|uniref:Uncharacterized protein n=1 Tax=Goodea atripinnis TaxID=208336 RepID=A0ABV0NAF6_9TELE